MWQTDAPSMYLRVLVSFSKLYISLCVLHAADV